MRGMVRRRRLVGAGATKPFAADGVVGDRLRGVWLTLASRWASPIAENCVPSPKPVEGGKHSDPRTTATKQCQMHAVRYP